MENMETGNPADSAQQSPPVVDQVLNGEQSQPSPGGGSEGSTGSHDPGYVFEAIFCSLHRDFAFSKMFIGGLSWQTTAGTFLFRTSLSFCDMCV